jgi:hypothetical protein
MEDGVLRVALSGTDLDLQLGDDRGLFVDVVGALAASGLGLVLRGRQVAPGVLAGENLLGVFDALFLAGLLERGLAGADLAFSRLDLGL